MTDGQLIDPVALIERTLGHVLERLAPEDAFVGHETKPPEDFIAAALGDRLVGMFGNGDASGDAGTWEAGDEVAELVERNGALAAALGACECWGELRGCPMCDGAGSPGWVVPDDRLFASYVRPAVSAFGVRTTPPVPQQEGAGHER